MIGGLGDLDRFRKSKVSSCCFGRRQLSRKWHRILKFPRLRGQNLNDRRLKILQWKDRPGHSQSRRYGISDIRCTFEGSYLSLSQIMGGVTQIETKVESLVLKTWENKGPAQVRNTFNGLSSVTNKLTTQFSEEIYSVRLERHICVQVQGQV